MIEIKRTGDRDPLEFKVVIAESGSETRHQVTMQRALYERLTDGSYPQKQCIEAAFRFLLDREPKEAILSRFDISLISSYFPEFEAEVPEYMSGGPAGGRP